MKRILAAAVIAAVLSPFALRVLAEDEPKESTLKGELLDLTAYLSKGKRGPENSDASEAAIRGGAPAAIVGEDGAVTVILFTGNEGREALKYVGHNVEITGVVYEKGGVRGVFTKSVKDLGSAEAPK